MPSWFRAALALFAVGWGANQFAALLPVYRDVDGATADYRVFERSGFSDVPDDTNRLLCLAVLADVAVTIGHGPGAAALYDLLAPHAGRQVVLNCFGGGGAYWGPVTTQLGRMAALLGDPVAAAAHVRSARQQAEAFGAPLALARIPTAP